MSTLAHWIRTNVSDRDFVKDQRVFVVFLADVAALVTVLGVLVFQGIFRGEPYMATTLFSVALVAAGAVISLVFLRFVGYDAAAHTTVAVGMIAGWLLNLQSAGDAVVKSNTVYLVVMSVLPALLLGRLWMIVYGIGTLAVVSYVTWALGQTPGVSTSMMRDYFVDATVGVIFVIFFTYITSDIYSRALERVRRLLSRQERQNTDLVRMSELVAQSEVQKRQFYRDTINSFTDGKLSICDSAEIRLIIASAEVEMAVPDNAAVTAVRHESAAYFERQGLTGERLYAFMIAVGEAVTNAVKHAFGGQVYAGRDDGCIWLAVVDHGRGIESLTLPKAVLLRGFSTKPSLGLGYSVILGTADRVLLKTDETGTTVVLYLSVVPRRPEDAFCNIPDTWEHVPVP